MSTQRDFATEPKGQPYEDVVILNSGSASPADIAGKQEEDLKSYWNSKAELVVAASLPPKLPVDDGIANQFLAGEGVDMVKFAIASADLEGLARMRDADAQLRLHYTTGYEDGEGPAVLIVVSLQVRRDGDLDLLDVMQSLVEKAVGDSLRDIVVVTLDYAG